MRAAPESKIKKTKERKVSLVAQLPRPRLVEVLKDEQDYDDRAENDHPIGNLNTCHRCFLLEPFHCLPPGSFGDNSKSGAG
jgi:hypothetical protein